MRIRKPFWLKRVTLHLHQFVGRPFSGIWSNTERLSGDQNEKNNAALPGLVAVWVWGSVGRQEVRGVGGGEGEGKVSLVVGCARGGLGVRGLSGGGGRGLGGGGVPVWALPARREVA